MRKLLQIPLILVLCLTLLPISATAITLGDYEANLQKFLDEAAAKQSEIDKTEAEIKETNNQIEAIKQEMKQLTAEVDTLHKEIVEYNKEIQEKSLQTKEIFQYFQMAKGENTYMEYIFGADDITDLIYRLAIVEQMTEYNNKITKELEEMIEANKQREKEIEVKNKELAQKKEELDKKIVVLGYSKETLREGAAKIETQINNYKEIIEGYKKVGCLSHHEIGVDCDTSHSAGPFKRPVSWGYITSEFGYRGGTTHTGLDITNWAPYNTKIYPVANGTVVAKYYDPYDALVVAIEHYDALTDQWYTSLYGHLDSFAPGLYVKQYVTSNDFIGYMGNTGYSTGPHLHFELIPCRLYGDSQCYDLNAYFAFSANQIYLGYKGPRTKINFPGTYTYWYNR